MIDDLIHPHLRKYPELKLLDTSLRALVENDLVKSAEMTMRYDSPFLIRKLLAGEDGHRKRRGRPRLGSRKKKT